MAAPQEQRLLTKACLNHDEFCYECGCGGMIFECNVCPRVYHPDCLGEHAKPTNAKLAKMGGEDEQSPNEAGGKEETHENKTNGKETSGSSSSSSDMWVCPWHSCKACGKASFAMTTGGIAWDETLQQASCISCPLTYCLSCCPPGLLDAATKPSEKVGTFTRSLYYQKHHNSPRCYMPTFYYYYIYIHIFSLLPTSP